MKCALELMAIREIADIAWAEEEAKKDEKAKLNYKTACANTIKFCDTELNEIFTCLALNRKKISYSCKIVASKDRLGNEIFRFVEHDGRKYANGNLSYSTESSLTYSWKTLVRYLKDHCFTVKVCNDNFMRYGWGEEKCARITIEMI